jgi:hypothetical protein
MRYYAPTAGYGHTYSEFKAPSPVGALMNNIPYDARAFNQACIKTGGSRRSKKRGGDGNLTMMSELFAPAKISELGSTHDFDNRVGVNLPVKYGGNRRSSRRSNKRRSNKRRSNKRN